MNFYQLAHWSFLKAIVLSGFLAQGQAGGTGSDCRTCNYIVQENQKFVDGIKEGILPGHVVCLHASFAYKALTFRNIHGSDTFPVIIRNCGGPVLIETAAPYVIRFIDSSHFRLTGGDEDGVYGIKVKGSRTNGVVIGGISAHFEVDHIEVSDVAFSGIMAKTDPSCDDAIIRGNYTMQNVSIHHNYIHDTGGEGLYLGHSAYGGVTKGCGLRLPHTIEHIRVFRNIVKNTGWDAIQLSSAPVGAEVFENSIENYATLNKPDQNSGIVIGGGTGGLCYNNLIKKGSGTGILVFGLADNTVYNNIIIEPGGDGIFCDERTAPGRGYFVLFNTIINPRGSGISIFAETVPENVVMNNLIVKPQEKDKAGTNRYVRIAGDGVKVSSSNNYFATSPANVRFIDAETNDFRLSSGSPAIDAGVDLGYFVIRNDFFNTPRLKGEKPDIGAHEH